jgi:mitochondrial fission protein ELM1
MPTRSLIVWRILDGKPGHEKQTRGLSQALASLVPVSLHDLPSNRRWRDWLHWLGGTFPAGQDLPRPDLILIAGHATHWAGLAARRAHGGRLIVLMRPSLPRGWFDL